MSSRAMDVYNTHLCFHFQISFDKLGLCQNLTVSGLVILLPGNVAAFTDLNEDFTHKTLSCIPPQ